MKEKKKKNLTYCRDKVLREISSKKKKVEEIK